MSCVIFDLDGTLADCEHRRHFIQEPDRMKEPARAASWKPDWDAFFAACNDDRPIEAVIEVNRHLYAQGVKVHIFSGRSDVVRRKTIRWLAHWGVKYDLLFMRPQGDNTPDEELKAAWVDAIGGTWVISYVFDDRDKVVKMWRSLGITCFQVAEGDF